MVRDDASLARAIAAAVVEARPERLVALAEQARTAEELEAVGHALASLNEALGDDEHDPTPLLLRAAVMRHGDAVPWTFQCGRSTFALTGERPWSLADAIQFAEAGPEGLLLIAPAELRAPWPRAAAAAEALAYAADLLASLRPACEVKCHALLVTTIGELRAGVDATWRLDTAGSLGRALGRAREVARLCAVAAEAAVDDAALSERAYVWAGTAVAIATVLAVVEADPCERLGELLRLRRAAIWPLHALEFERERWYSEAMAGYDDLLLGDEVAPQAFAAIEAILRAAIAGLMRPHAG